MKKTNLQKKLQLNRVSVRPLTFVQLTAVVGGAAREPERPVSKVDDGNQCGTLQE